MPLTLDLDLRENGLVFIEEADDSEPRTHALIVGIGRFDEGAGVGAISSPPKSARELTSWFLDGALNRGPGFKQPEKPLASLAVLLSEAEDSSMSEIGGGPVPRASFGKLKKAVRAWIERAETNPKNNMILFVASHGVSAGRRTGVLCEDYGRDPDEHTAGMIDIDRFVKAMRKVDVEGKLLIFDCCRVEGVEFDQDETLGRPIFERKQTEPTMLEPIVMCSTVLGKQAFGEIDGPTLFTRALLDALGGLASDPNGNWRIDNARLVDTINKLLRLHEKDSKPVQLPQFQLSNDFTIAVAKPRGNPEVTLFLTVEEPFSNDLWSVELTSPSGSISEWEPSVEGERYVKLRYPAHTDHSLHLLDSDGELASTTEAPKYPPVGFLSIPNPYDEITTERSKSGDDCGSLTVQGFSDEGGVLTLRQIASPAESRTKASEDKNYKPQTTSEWDDYTFEDLSPGRYQVEFDRNDGARFVSTIEISDGDHIDLTVPGPESPHEWMVDAVAAGVVPAGARPVTESNFERTPDFWALTAGDARSRLGGSSIEPPADVSLSAELENRDGRFLRFKMLDENGTRYYVGDPDAPSPPWLLFQGEDWTEMAFVPTLGPNGRTGADWTTSVLIDAAPQFGSHVRPFVSSRRWHPLIAFLGRRDFPRASAALRLLGDDLREAVEEKIVNPLAACAGALTAVACGPIEAFEIEEQWLRNLTKWFVNLPDGPVALGRHLQIRGDVEGAKEAFRLAQERGIPAFSLSVDWLAEGLGMLDPDHAGEALAWSRRVDPLSPFTILKLETKESAVV